MNPRPFSDEAFRPGRLQAVRLLLARAVRPEAVFAAPWEAAGRVAAEEVRAPGGVPEQPVSLRDGYALRADETRAAAQNAPLRLAAHGRLTADSRHPEALAPGNAVRILTGAPLPPGADAVIPLEHLAAKPDQDFILLDRPAEPGAFILPRGGDLPAGSLLARAGERLTPQACAVLTRARVERLRVLPRPRAAMFGLGSELAAPTQGGDPERIPADNVVLAANLLRAWGMDMTRCGVLPDDRRAIARELDNASGGEDAPALIVTTGGTGRSERDFARKAAEDAGFATLFSGLDVRPGKNAFAAFRPGEGGGCLLLGLPGPPAAVFACLHALALPLARFYSGTSDGTDATAGRAVLRSGLRTRRGSEWLVPCELRLDGGVLSAEPLHGDHWPSLLALARANAVLALPAERDLPPGEPVELLCGPDALPDSGTSLLQDAPVRSDAPLGPQSPSAGKQRSS